MTSADKTVKTSQYSSIAPIYDELMQHVNYHYWAHYISAILDNEAENPEYILELACGTGILAENLANYGYTIHGFDKSAEMISYANEKRGGDSLKFQVGEFADFTVEREYDAAVCLYDSINYILNDDEVIDFLVKVNDALVPGGIFIFDICTRYNSSVHFRKYSDEGKINGYKYYRYSDYSPLTHLHINNFKVYKIDDPRELYEENHTQFIYTIQQMRGFIRKSGFKLVAEYDDMTFNRGYNRSFRVHFVLRKPK